MKISVLIPTRDRAHFLAEAIASVQRQTLRPHEIIVIDDGSQDSTPDLLRSLAGEVLALRQASSGGKSRALNRGTEASSGEALIVLDDDDLFPPDTLEFHANALARTPEADFSYGRFFLFSGAPPNPAAIGDSDPGVYPVPSDDPRRTVVKLMEDCFLPNPAWMARRTALERAGPYDVEASRSQDYDMILRLARENDGVFTDRIVLLQRHHEGLRPGVRATTGGSDRFQAWRQHDRRIFERMAREWPIESFRPLEGIEPAECAVRAAWLQKGVLMFLRGCYEAAAEAFERRASLVEPLAVSSVEESVAARLFHLLFRNTPVAHLPSRREYALAAGAVQRPAWPAVLRRAFARGGRWHVRAALKGGDIALAAKFLRVMSDFAGPGAVAASMSARLTGGDA